MTDMATSIPTGQSTPTETHVSTSNSAPTQSAPPAEERTFRQSEVNDLIGRAKSEAIERFKRDTSLASHQAQQQIYQQQPSYVPQNQYQAQPQIQNYESEMRRLAAEEANRLKSEWEHDALRQNQEAQAHKIANDFFQRYETGKTKYDDFDKVMSGVKLDTIPDIVRMSVMVDNTSDVMYELAKNPAKIGNLYQLLNIDPNLAITEMQRLSQSIKDNANAANYKSPNEPLSQLRPSNQGTGEGGALTVADYKKKYKV